MFSSPGMPKMYSTPSFSRHLTNSSAAFMESPLAAGTAVSVVFDVLDQRGGQIGSRCLAAQVARPDQVLIQRSIDGAAQPQCQVLTADVFEHQGPSQQQ